MQTLLRYIELVLTAAGVAVILAVFVIFHRMGPWKAAALAGLGVGVIHGIIFFAVRNAQRHARNRAVHAIRDNFDNLVRNKLQVVLFATEIQEQDWRPAAQRAVEEIRDNLDRIEAESLTASGFGEGGKGSADISYLASLWAKRG